MSMSKNKRSNERLCGHLSTRLGFAIPTAILAVFVAAFFLATLSTMNRGYKAGLQHLDARQHMFNVAFSAYSSVLARLSEKAWNDRFFKGAPFAQSGVNHDDATYDLYVTDTAGKQYQADLYIRVKVGKASQLFFWRFQYVDDILDTSGRAYPLVFLDAEADYYPGGSKSLDAKIADILQQRKQNRPKAMGKTKLAQTLTSVNDVAQVVTARPQGTLIPESAVGTQNPSAPAIPGFYDDSNDRGQLGDKTPPPAPSNPPEYTGPQEFGDSGSGVRVATKGGTVSVNVCCINEKGTRVMVAVNGNPVLSWKSKEDHSYLVNKGNWIKKVAGMDPVEKERSKQEFNKFVRKSFKKTFTISPGDKVTTSYVGKKSPTGHKAWFQLTGPF